MVASVIAAFPWKSVPFGSRGGVQRVCTCTKENRGACHFTGPNFHLPKA